MVGFYLGVMIGIVFGCIVGPITIGQIVIGIVQDIRKEKEL